MEEVTDEEIRKSCRKEAIIAHNLWRICVRATIDTREDGTWIDETNVPPPHPAFPPPSQAQSFLPRLLPFSSAVALLVAVAAVSDPRLPLLHAVNCGQSFSQ